MYLPPDYDWSASDEPPRDTAGAAPAGIGFLAVLFIIAAVIGLMVSVVKPTPLPAHGPKKLNQQHKPEAPK